MTTGGNMSDLDLMDLLERAKAELIRLQESIKKYEDKKAQSTPTRIIEVEADDEMEE